MSLPSTHFLAHTFAAGSLPAAGGFLAAGPPSQAPAPAGFDTSTLAAHDFDVDTRTGFMPPQAPLARLPLAWDAWESALDAACARPLQLASKLGLTDTEAEQSATWREEIRQMPVLDAATLHGERVLRRAHCVLAWLMHFYVHTLPLDVPIVIPLPIARPLLALCARLRLPPVLTYSDDVLYNWSLDGHAPGALAPDPEDPEPTPDALRVLTTFTGTRDEAEFYLASARIELRGATALALMRASMDEAFVGDALALARIAAYLRALADTIATLTSTLLAVRAGCDPAVFYNEIRPWFRGEDAAPGARAWAFEGAEPGAEWTRELSGPSAGQSSLVHALDVFLGVAPATHAPALTGHTVPAAGAAAGTGPTAHAKPFLERMQAYMPRHHRAFLDHLARAPRPLRALVQAAPGAPGLRDAYDAAVRALLAFRDAHFRVVALYIVGPARRAAEAQAAAAAAAAAPVEALGVAPAPVPADADALARGAKAADRGRWLAPGTDEDSGADAPLKGTGGTELVRFLKGVRDRTAGAVLGEDAGA